MLILIKGKNKKLKKYSAISDEFGTFYISSDSELPKRKKSNIKDFKLNHTSKDKIFNC